MRVTGDPETSLQSANSGWESLIWPRWLPLQARLPLIAQIAGAMALVAAVAMPRWTTPAVPVVPTLPPGPPVVPASAPVVPAAPGTTGEPVRPAHLNLDVRHSLRSVDLSVTVDGKSMLETRLAGSGKRFGVVGKRAERGFTRTLDIDPGVRIVRVRVRSAEDKFDQTRVERFDLDSASVAAMRISADRSGLSVVADRPAAPKAPAAPQVASLASVAPLLVPQEIPPPARAAQATTAQQAAQAAQSAQEASALAELYQSLRSVLIAMAGFIASAATGFLVQEFMRTRKALIFAQENGQMPVRLSHAERRRRRRAGKSTEDPVTAP
jgi:hypothetical protein